MIRRSVLILLLACVAFGQNPSLVLPDAPDPQPPPHSLDQNVKFLTNWQTLRSKTLWAYYGVAILPGVLDAEVSHAGLAHHHCSEAHGLNSRGQLYENNAMEWGAEIIFGFVATKIKMPKWMLFPTAAAPVAIHGRATAGWLENCW